MHHLPSVSGEREDCDNAATVGRSLEQSVCRATARLAVAILASRWEMLQNIPGRDAIISVIYKKRLQLEFANNRFVRDF